MKHKYLFLFLALSYKALAFGEPEVEIFAYINSDNDILQINEQLIATSYGDIFYDQLKEEFLDHPDVALHVYLDSNKNLLTQYPYTRLDSWQGRQLKITESWGETNSGHSYFLEKLLQRRFSSRSKTIVIIWSHGDGIEDIRSFDFSSPNKVFSYSNFVAPIKNMHPDILIFDSCRMGSFELVHEYSEAVEYLILSQFSLPAEGFDYSNTLKSIEFGFKVDNWAESFYKNLLVSTRRENKKVYPILVKAKEFNHFLSLFNASMDELGAEKIGTNTWYDILKFSFRKDPYVVGSASEHDIRRFLYMLKKKSLLSNYEKLVLKLNAIFYEAFGSLSLLLPKYNEVIPFNKYKDSGWQKVTNLKHWNLFNQIKQGE